METTIDEEDEPSPNKKLKITPDESENIENISDNNQTLPQMEFEETPIAESFHRALIMDDSIISGWDENDFDDSEPTPQKMPEEMENYYLIMREMERDQVRTEEVIETVPKIDDISKILVDNLKGEKVN